MRSLLYALGGTFFFFFFWWQVLLSPIYIKTGLPALSLIPDPQVRGELWVTLRSHTFRSGHLSDKAFDVASFHVWGPQQGGEKLPRTQGSQTVLQQQLFIITVSYDVISQAPRCCRRKKEAIPCYQELQNILRKKKWQRISRWAQDESKAILGLTLCFAKLTRWVVLVCFVFF